ncbi:MAG: CPXCG motif-containing cysteine-rich protein [Solirubrobacterales bacterium]
MRDEVTVTCPWCWEPVGLVVDPAISGRMTLDCEVCCRPWDVEVRWSGPEPEVSVEQQQ